MWVASIMGPSFFLTSCTWNKGGTTLDSRKHVLLKQVVFFNGAYSSCLMKGWSHCGSQETSLTTRPDRPSTFDVCSFNWRERRGWADSMVEEKESLMGSTDSCAILCVSSL